MAQRPQLSHGTVPERDDEKRRLEASRKKRASAFVDEQRGDDNSRRTRAQQTSRFVTEPGNRCQNGQRTSTFINKKQSNDESHRLRIINDAGKQCQECGRRTNTFVMKTKIFGQPEEMRNDGSRHFKTRQTSGLVNQRQRGQPDGMRRADTLVTEFREQLSGPGRANTLVKFREKPQRGQRDDGGKSSSEHEASQGAHWP